MNKDLKLVLDLQKRVKEGIGYLNYNKKGWLNKIDLEILNLQSEHSCVLGQTFDGFWNKVIEAMEKPQKNKLTFDQAVKYGFALSNEDNINGWYDYLTRVWYVEIFKLKHK